MAYKYNILWFKLYTLKACSLHIKPSYRWNWSLRSPRLNPRHRRNQTCYSRRPSLAQGATRVALPRSQWALDLFLVSQCD